MWQVILRMVASRDDMRGFLTFHGVCILSGLQWSASTSFCKEKILGCSGTASSSLDTCTATP
eukprot:6244293-Amphidinium_carterae.1